MKDLVIGAFLAATILAAPSALAKKNADDAEAPVAMIIETTGLASMDTFFGKVKEHADAITTTREAMDDANANLAKALELPEGTPVADALADLKAKAEGKLELAMEGTRPTLKAEEGVPANVQAAVEAVNGMTASLSQAVETLQAVVAQSPALAQEAKTLPGKIPSEAKAAGLKMRQVPEVTKKVKGNISATGAMPERSQELLDSANTTLGLVKSTFTN